LISTEIEFSAPGTLVGVLSVLAEYEATVLSGAGECFMRAAAAAAR
jgi:hypothetical protein